MKRVPRNNSVRAADKAIPQAARCPLRDCSPWKARLATCGAAGFLFFLIKGLLWLTVPVLIAKGWISGF